MNNSIVKHGFTPDAYDNQILHYQEAKSRLSTLEPETEEYSKLQNALNKTEGIVEVSLPNTTYKVNACGKDGKLLGGFGSSEHVAIGKDVDLPIIGKNTSLLEKRGTTVQFAHIIALAGDFYGVPGGAISLPGGSETDKAERFMHAFNTLADADDTEVRKIISAIEDECHKVENNSLPHHCYSYQMIEKNNEIRKIKSNINELLVDNSDHFTTNAEEAYLVGHKLAIEAARVAGETKDLEGLKRAYALDAFACHFLTDLFAAGHIRNQRGDLEKCLINTLGFKESWAKPLAGLLTGAQHEFDGNNGLNVWATDLNGQRVEWRAYGDGNFFTSKNLANKEMAVAAVEQSVQEVASAYNHPDQEVKLKVPQLIPHPIDLNPLPIYVVEKDLQENDSLFLLSHGDKIGINSKADFILKAGEQALRYLPQQYIDGVLSLDGILSSVGVEKSAILDKVVIPLVERITGSFWHVIGISTYHQVNKASNELKEQISEMADTLRSIYENTEKILQQMQQVIIKLDDLKWDNLSKEITESVGTIKDAMHRYKNFTLTNEQESKTKDNLFEACTTLSRVFNEGTANNTMILSAYTEMLSQTMKKDKVKPLVTLWFRQILACQVDAFALYASIQLKSNDEKIRETVRQQAFDCGRLILSQIEANKDFIDQKLIFKSIKEIKQKTQETKAIEQFEIDITNHYQIKY